MTSSDRGLNRIRAIGSTKFFGTLEGRQSTTDEELIPTPAVLFKKQNRLPRRAGARSRTRSLDFHQRDQAMHLRFAGRELGQDTPQAQCVLTQRRAYQIVTRCR